MSYKLNFNDLSRLVDDLFYLFQKGGRNKELLINSQPKNYVKIVIDIFVTILKLVLIIVLCYTIYIILFRGYSRIILDLLMFNFYNKEKLDDLIQEKGLLTNQFKFLSDNNNNCLTPYNIYQFIYGPTNLSSYIIELNKYKDEQYKQYKYDEKYLYLFKEYYLFYNKITNDVTEEIWNKDKKINIQYANFYELYLTYKINQGLISTANPEGGNKSVDQLLYDLYTSEKANKFINFNNLNNINKVLKNIAKEVSIMNDIFIKYPINQYLILPNDKDNSKILLDLSNFKNYDSMEYIKLNDISWFIIEFINSTKINNQYQVFSKNIPLFQNEDKSKIIYYLNLPRNSKLNAEKRIMNYTQNEKFYEFIKKRPIFAHVYFSDNKNKEELYKKIMLTYNLLLACGSNKKIDINDESLNNLKKNGLILKNLVIAISYIHLFLNIYQKNLTEMYEKQIISNKRFLKELWTPFLEDIIKNRLGNAAKYTFSSTSWKKSFKNFNVKWNQLGTDLNRIIKAVFKSFFTSVPIEKPEETETDDSAAMAKADAQNSQT